MCGRMAQYRSLGFFIMDAARLLRKRFEQEARHLGMTSAQLQILGRIAINERINQSRLAALLDMEPITVCRHVDRMEAAGLVERHSDPADRRVRLLSVTEKGRELIPQMREIAQRILGEAQRDLSEEHRGLFLDILETFVRNLSTRPADQSDHAIDAARAAS
jgi:DNA-binding MarR family transcriptional regulator